MGAAVGVTVQGHSDLTFSEPSRHPQIVPQPETWDAYLQTDSRSSTDLSPTVTHPQACSVQDGAYNPTYPPKARSSLILLRMPYLRPAHVTEIYYLRKRPTECSFRPHSHILNLGIF